MAWYSLTSEAYAINETIDLSQFGQRSSKPMDPSYIIGFAAIVVLFIIAGVLYSRFNARRMRKVDQRYLQKKEELQQQQADFSEDTSERIDMLAKAVNADPDRILNSNKAFEAAVQKLRKQNPQDPLLTKIPLLREDLGYIFFNRKVPFICTQMLQPGQKLRVSVNYKGKSHSYVSTVINTDEAVFWVKPPTAKGKAVDLSKFKRFGFSVFRKNDGEYRCACPLKAQISTPANALVLEHVNKIKKLHTREHDRYQLQFQREFFFSDLNTNVGCTGVVMDISIGGLKVLVKEIPPGVEKGGHVFFKLEEAEIKQEIKAEIVRLSEKSGKHFIHLQFQDMSELNRLHLQKFVAGKKPVKVE